MTEAYFERIGEGAFRPTAHVSGAWNENEIHFSPLGGLLVHAIDGHRAAAGNDGKQLGRVSFDILGFLELADCDIRVETIRPGRTIELVEATASIGGRAVVRARAWFLVAGDTSAVAGGAGATLPDPATVEPLSIVDIWSGGFVASIDFRPVEGPEPGRTTAWARSAIELVAGEPVSAHAAFVALVDLANGIAVRQSPTEWAFPNLDLTIHLHRQPGGGWVGFETSVIFGPTGLGITSSVLHDVDGPVGFAEQILTVRSLQN